MHSHFSFCSSYHSRQLYFNEMKISIKIPFWWFYCIFISLRLCVVISQLRFSYPSARCNYHNSHRKKNLKHFDRFKLNRFRKIKRQSHSKSFSWESDCGIDTQRVRYMGDSRYNVFDFCNIQFRVNCFDWCVCVCMYFFFFSGCSRGALSDLLRM